MRLICVIGVLVLLCASATALNKSMPIEDSGQFQFVGEAGGGVRVFTSDKRAVSVGVRFHHISNGDRHGANRGLNNFLIYAGFSVFK